MKYVNGRKARAQAGQRAVPAPAAARGALRHKGNPAEGVDITVAAQRALRGERNIPALIAAKQNVFSRAMFS